MSENVSPEWSPHPLFPQEPEFYRRVLDFLPTAILVVSSTGEIRFGNRAMLALARLSVDEGLGTNLLHYVHPDDQLWVTEAFTQIAAQPESRVLGGGGPWAEVFLRFVAADGTTTPVEVVGTGGVLDPTVDGIIYEVRATQPGDLLGRVLDGLNRGASIQYLLSLVVDLIERPPLDLHAAILQSTPGGGFMLAASNLAELSTALVSHSCVGPWQVSTTEPLAIAPDALPASFESALRDAGLHGCWYVGVESPIASMTLRVLVSSRSRQLPASGVVNRLLRARELASAVLVRSQTEELFDKAAGIDTLTDLPNLPALHRLVSSLDPTCHRGVVHLELEGLQPVTARLGKASSELVIRIVADRIRSICAPDDIVSRVADLAFTIVLTHADRHELEERVATAADAALQAALDVVVVGGRPVEISCSVGVATAAPTVDIDVVLTHADAAMHSAKGAGGRQIYSVTPNHPRS